MAIKCFNLQSCDRMITEIATGGGDQLMFVDVLDLLRLQGGAAGDAEGYMAMAKDTIEQLKALAVDLRQQGQPNDNIVRT